MCQTVITTDPLTEVHLLRGLADSILQVVDLLVVALQALHLEQAPVVPLPVGRVTRRR